MPETIFDLTVNKGRVNPVKYHFEAFGFVVVLFIEYESRGPIERLDAIAQVIAECNGRAPF